VSVGDWLRRLFGGPSREDEAAEREEYGLPDRGEPELERPAPARSYGAAEGAEAAKDDLESFERPSDPAP
jgi:hypothetical protein